MQNVMRDAPRLTRAQRRELEAELRQELARLERLIAPRAPLSDAAPFEARLGAMVSSDANEHVGLATALHSRAAARYAAVSHALERLKDGSYGVCVSCQRPIPYGRLLAMPETAHCVECGARA
jgi:DnaK suppressor protein